MMIKLIATFLFVTLVTCERERYDGYNLLTVTPIDDMQHIALQDLLETRKFITLKEPTKAGSQASILVPEEEMEYLVSFFRDNSIEYFIENNNIQEDLDEMWKRLDEKKEFSLDDFNTLEQIEGKIDEWQSSCVEGFQCEIEVIGNSYEGRPLKVLKIEKAGENRKILWFDSTIHAREWLAPATNLRVANTIFENENEDAKRLLAKYDWYFLFVVNPDGYKFTWDSQRFWRKSRNPNVGSLCIGTDLNRNFAYKWLNGGASTNPCSETYAGSAAGSEPEVSSVQNKATALSSRVVAWTSIHTFGNMWLTPYGFLTDGACTTPSDYNDIYYVSEKTATAIMNTFGTSWVYGSTCTVIYPASGITPDYTYSVGIKYSFTPELRGPGFSPSKDEIPKSYQEFWNGVVAMVAAIEEREGY